MGEYQGEGVTFKTILGRRLWEIDRDGALASPSQHFVWTPGINRFECNASYMAEEERPADWANLDWTTRRELTEAWKASDRHQIDTCQHGFYGMMDKNAPPGYLTKVPVHGIIEASGEVALGTKGFRASEARIVAILIDTVDDVWQMTEMVERRLRDNYPDVTFFTSKMRMEMEFTPTRLEDVVIEEIPNTIEELEEL